MNQKSLFIGVGVTIVWFLGITIFCIWGNFGFEKNDLNSLGDFLAGIFAPVAFFWLKMECRSVCMKVILIL